MDLCRIVSRIWNHVALIEKGLRRRHLHSHQVLPTKTMVHRAQVAHYARDAARWGVRAENVSVDLPTIVAQKNKVVLSFRGGREKQINRRENIHFYKGHARFVAAHQVSVQQPGSEAVLLESEKIFINTGCRPRIPRIPGLDTIKYLTNESIMDLDAVPEHLIVLGGGYTLASEFSVRWFRRFGSRVTLDITNTQPNCCRTRTRKCPRNYRRS